jgi:hypothetical protein
MNSPKFRRFLLANVLFHLGRRAALAVKTNARRLVRVLSRIGSRVGGALRYDGLRRIVTVTAGSALIGAFAFPAFAMGPAIVDNTHEGLTIVAADGITVVS